MIAFAGNVLAYTEGLDQAGFVASGLTYDATLRNLELGGKEDRWFDLVSGIEWMADRASTTIPRKTPGRRNRGCS